MNATLRRTALCTIIAPLILFGCNAILGNKHPDDLELGGLGGEGNTDGNTSNPGDGDATGDGDGNMGSGGRSTTSGNSESGGSSNSSGGSGEIPDPDGCYDDDDDPDTACVPWTTCSPGSYVKEKGTDTSDRSCEECAAGFYSTIDNSTACLACEDGTFAAEDGATSCEAWTACDWSESTSKSGTSTTDAKCVVGSDARDFDTEGPDYSAGVAVDSAENVYWLVNSGSDLDNPDVYDPDCVTTSTCPDPHTLLIKYNKRGNEMWRRVIDSPAEDVGKAVTVDSRGNVYVAGYTYGPLDGNNAGGADIFVTKIAPSGTISWTRQFGTSSDDFGYSIAVDADDAVYVAGETAGLLDDGGFNPGGTDMVVRRYNSMGEVGFTHQFGDSSSESAVSVAVDKNGLVYLAGTTYSDPFYSEWMLDDASSEIAVIIFNPADSPIAPVPHLINFGDRFYHQATKITPAGDGTFFVSGISSLSSMTTGYLSKFAATGTSAWTTPITVVSTISGSVADFGLDAAGHFVLIGQVDRPEDGFGNDIYQRDSIVISKANPSGEVAWSRTYGSEDIGNSTKFMDMPAGLALGTSGRAYVAITTDGRFTASGAAKNGGASLKMVDVPAIDDAN